MKRPMRVSQHPSDLEGRCNRGDGERTGAGWLLVGGRLAALDGLGQLVPAAGDIEDVLGHVERDHKRAVVTRPELGTGGGVCMLNVGIPDVGVLSS